METYSVVVSIYGWTIKNIRSGKIVTGTMEKMPDAIFSTLKGHLRLGDKTICTAATVSIPGPNGFNHWFRGTF